MSDNSVHAILYSYYCVDFKKYTYYILFKKNGRNGDASVTTYICYDRYQVLFCGTILSKPCYLPCTSYIANNGIDLS